MNRSKIHHAKIYRMMEADTRDTALRRMYTAAGVRLGISLLCFVLSGFRGMFKRWGGVSQGAAGGVYALFCVYKKYTKITFPMLSVCTSVCTEGK